MKIKYQFLFQLFFLLLLILASYFALLFCSVIHIETDKVIFISLSLICVSFLGAIILFPEIGKNEEGFVIRFLIMTTFQLLFMMSVLLFETYHFTQIKQVVFHQLTLFTAYIIFHSILLYSFQKNNKS